MNAKTSHNRLTCDRCGKAKPIGHFSMGLDREPTTCCDCANELETRRCKTCLQVRPITSFRVNNSGQNSRRHQCKRCDSAAAARNAHSREMRRFNELLRFPVASELQV